MSLPDSSQPVTIIIVGVMEIRQIEAHVRAKNRHEASTKEQLEESSCQKDINLFETVPKILN